jgi:hypothetical protein
VQIRDNGEQYDSSQIKQGGLRAHFTNEIMYDVSYCTESAKGTLLTIVKKLKSELTLA